MDLMFTCPGTSFRIGLDGLLGLIPGVGDAAGTVVALYLVNEARRLGAPNTLITRMLANVGIDMLIGAVPVFGDVRSEEHTSELQSLMRISYAVFCLKKKKETHPHHYTTNTTDN